MSDKKRGLAWLWVLLIIGAGVVAGYAWYKYSQPETSEEQVTVEVSVSEEAAPGEPYKKGVSEEGDGTEDKVPGAEEKALKAGEEPAEQRGDAIIEDEKDTGIKPKPTGEMVTYQFESGEQASLPGDERARASVQASGQVQGQATGQARGQTPGQVSGQVSDKAPSQGQGQGPEQRAYEKAANDRQARYCEMIEGYVQDYFQYLDTKQYIQNLNLGQTAYDRFKQVMERLAVNQPIPAGEGVDPAIMVKNIYFFCRALDKKDLSLAKEAVSHDRDALEDNMGLLYQWLMLGNGCPNPGNVRPSFNGLYRYAGFFLNTTGGRAYMFRRGLKVRLLVSFYAVQIIYQADKAGRNIYGINALPYIKMLMEEMRNYSDLIYQQNYLKTLSKIEAFYSSRR